MLLSHRTHICIYIYIIFCNYLHNYFCRFQIYTDWANYYLERGGCKKRVIDLQADLCDGVLLADLVEAVSKYISHSHFFLKRNQSENIYKMKKISRRLTYKLIVLTL